MATSSILFFTIFVLTCLTPFTTANLHSTTTFLRSNHIYELNALLTTQNNTQPTKVFEVTKPIKLPKTKPCSHLVLQQDFGFTYGQPPALRNYTPPAPCHANKFSKIVLEWKATSKGRQYDRIFGVWLGGVELLRGCTAEPSETGIVWTVEKDVTKYQSLLLNHSTLAVYLGNLVNNIYTGVYHVNVTFHYYPADQNGVVVVNDDGGVADLILPISRDLPLNDALWFGIGNSKDVAVKEFRIPPNVYKAVLEVYVSFHQNDEFWYQNFPNEYITGNNLTDARGNGPFREVVVGLDELVVGAVWPFTVIFTGGVNPLLWRPITGIGSFDLPSYDIEITPLLGMLLDGKSHNITFGVTNALNVWYIDANLHLWLDKKSAKTKGKLLNYNNVPLSSSNLLNFTGRNGKFVKNASRSIVSNGWVKSSHGVINTKVVQGFEYINSMVLGHDGNLQILDQVTRFKGSVDTKKPSSPVRSTKSLKKFHLHMYFEDVEKGNGSYVSLSNVTLGINGKMQKSSETGTSVEQLKNEQKGQVSLFVKGNTVVSGSVGTQQVYRFTSNDLCYFRNVSSSNTRILHDEESNTCTTRGWWSFLRRKVVL